MNFLSNMLVEPDRSHSQPPIATQNSIVSLLSTLAPLEGSQSSPIEGVTLLRISHAVPRMPVLYEPSVVFVAQGNKRGFIGKRNFVYNANTYLVLAAPLAFECETEASEKSPLLSIYVRLRRETISELLTAISPDRVPPASRPRTIESVPLDAALADAVVRLLRSMQSIDDAKVLGPHLVREITYRVLLGRQGHALRAMVGFDGHFPQVCRALQQIHSDYAKDLNVGQLAKIAGMSPSVFHLHFKAVAAKSPVQYLKAVRLHKARSLMLDEGLGAASAAARVGYESPSQFGREFKRYFGHSPLNEASRLRSEPMID